jgi:hypothetical protein
LTVYGTEVHSPPLIARVWSVRLQPRMI